jgi:hypothetical protein
MTDRQRLLPVLLSSLAVSVLAIVFTFWWVRESERKWCEMMLILDEGYNAPVQPGQPELTERGKRLAVAIHNFRASLPCDK